MLSITLAIFLLSAQTSTAETEQDVIEHVTKRAEAPRDMETRRRMGIPANTTPATITKRVAAWFQRLYVISPRPGRIVSLQIVGADGDFALVSYRYADAFHMRLVNGEWYYTLDDPSGTVGSYTDPHRPIGWRVLHRTLRQQMP